VADFGLSDSIKKNTETFDQGGGYKGTPYYLAPEILKASWFNEKVDVYAYGLVLWELLCGKRLWRDLGWGTWEWKDLKQNICYDEVRPPLPETWPPKLQALVKRCWTDDYLERPTFEGVVQDLNECIVLTVISDFDGQAFWIEHFVGQETAPWDTFNELMARRLSVQAGSPNLEALKAILVKQQKAETFKSQESLTIEQFGKVLDWFSPAPLQPRSRWLDELLRLVSCKWFHGEIDVRDTEDRLQDQEHGTYLVRFSSSNPGGYALSAITAAGKVQHLRILHPPGSSSYAVGNTEYADIHTLVEDKVKTLSLTKACPGSMFASLGRANAVSNYMSDWQ